MKMIRARYEMEAGSMMRVALQCCMGIVLLWMGFQGSAVPSAHAMQDEYRVPLGSEPASLDPAFITDIYSVTVAMNLFDGLVEFDKDLNIVPAVAKIWIISRDHRTYTFYLNEGIKFHNGREVTAEDFVYSFQRILSPDVKSPAASLFLPIDGAEDFQAGRASSVTGLTAVDKHTLKIQLKEPFAPFLSILAMANAKVVPREAVNDQFSKKPVGTGAFRFTAWEPGKAVVLTANPAYFGGPPKLSTLTFKIYLNDPWELIFGDFEKGLLDQAVIPRGRYDEITAGSTYKDRYRFVSSPGLNLVYVGMNETVAPLDDVRVRQAISCAVDTKSIVEGITKKGSIPAKGLLPQGIAGHDPELQSLPYDPARARKLLADAGFPDGKDFPAIDIWTVSKDQSVHKELEAYKEYLGAVGIRVSIQVAENWKEFVARINEKKAPMFYAAWYADYPDADNFLYVLCHSKSPTNRMGYRNPKIDQMLEDARKEMDYMKRADMYREIQRLIMADAPLICQHVNSFSCLFQPWVKNVELSYLGPAYISYKDIIMDRQ